MGENSIDHLDKKKKLPYQPLEIPSPKKIQCNTIGELCQESTGSNIFNFNNDDDEVKTDLQYSDTCYSDFSISETCYSDFSSACYSDFSSSACYSDFPTSSASFSSAVTSPGYSTFYSSDLKSSTNTSSSEPKSMSINQQPDCSNFDSSISKNEKSGNDQEFIDTELESFLYPNMVAQNSNNYILSSGRCHINQDFQESEKQTIDKEFEQYFSDLML